MGELEILRLLALGGVLIMLAAIWYTVTPLADANGERPILATLVFVALVELAAAVQLMDLAYNLDEINSTGRAYVWVFTLRLHTYPIGLSLIWLGRWFRKRMSH